ncbi:hypothetical protein Ahia01_000155800 [Argonauta hians]
MEQNLLRPVSGIKPPSCLVLEENIAENFKTFKQKWLNYAILINLPTYPKEYQVALLLNTLGDEALKVYNGFHFATPENDRTIAEIIAKFEQFAVGEVNKTNERFMFNKRVQKDGETFESFQSSVRSLVKSCNYCPNCVDSIIRDRLVLGISDQTTQQSLLRERNLTLQQCIDICKAAENVSIQTKILRPEMVNSVRIKSKNMTPKKYKSFDQSRPSNAPDSSECGCKFCGSQHRMNRDDCPAWGKTCNKCKRRNHFANKCPNKKKHDAHRVRNVNETEGSEDERINSVNNGSEKPVKCKMIVDSKTIIFTIDPGASVNIIPFKMVKHKKIRRTSKNLKMWNESKVNPVGTIELMLTNPANNDRNLVEFVVVKENYIPLLGAGTSTKMKLVTIHKENIEQIFSVMSGDKFKEAKDIFNDELGSFKGKIKLTVNENVTPVVMPSRRVPLALRPKLKVELKRLESLGVITPVNEPTPWVSQIAITQKKSGKLRVCLDPQELNKALLREHYTLPVLEDSLHELSKSKVFSKADLASGYWHVQLDDSSSMLTTFQTCFGRYRWLRLPFGLSVSSEIFQKKLNQELLGLSGVLCIADDVLIHGSDYEEHNKNLDAFLVRCCERNIKLNPDKFQLRMSEISFMGHLITKDGLHSDPEKTRAINEMAPPCSLEELRRYLGLVNYLSKFLPNLTEVTAPMRNLTKKSVPWVWSSVQQDAFDKVKKMVTKAPVLAFYDPEKELTVENDACEHGLGSVLLQEGRPVAFASRSLTDTERNYAQIEKEMLAVTFGLEKFHQYTYGRRVTIITDHKPLVSIMKKPLSKAPNRLQSFLLRTQKYSFDIIYKPGNMIPVADTLSRAPLPDKPKSDNVYVNNISHLSIKDKRLDDIRSATLKDNAMGKLKTVIMEGWPAERSNLPSELIPYFSYRDEMTVQDGLILCGERVVIPCAMRKEIKEKLHVGHMGINSCLRRARNLVFWPAMSSEIRQYIETCDICACFGAKQPQEPFHMHDIPDHPWQKVGTDIFTLQGRNYLVTTDYYSNFFELDFLPETTSEVVVSKMKHHFARHGIPNVVISDGGPQYTGEKFQKFSKSWGFSHETSSSGNSKANGAAEAAVKIAKGMMRKCHLSKEDPYIGLLNIRNTPQEGLASSPAQRLFGRETKTQIPCARENIQRHKPYKELLEDKRMDVVNRRNEGRPLSSSIQVTLFECSLCSMARKNGSKQL